MTRAQWSRLDELVEGMARLEPQDIGRAEKAVVVLLDVTDLRLLTTAPRPLLARRGRKRVGLVDLRVVPS